MHAVAGWAYFSITIIILNNPRGISSQGAVVRTAMVQIDPVIIIIIGEYETDAVGVSV
ncbi:hypothetical protein FACS1894184_18610 [Clostridia bacterium]|nr:hypothetical protein FACS1894184_18610 [Clostridia bacterium]